MKSDIGTENDKMNNENQPNEDSSGSCSGKKKMILIGSIAGGIVVIAAIVVIVVLVTKDDDSSSSSSSSYSVSDGISWEEAIDKANKAMENLSNEEKFNLLFGVDNLVNMWNATKKVCVGMIEPNSKIENFRGLCLQDGPAGVRVSASTTSWQAQINTASTFNRTLWTEYGKAYGNEFKAKGINVALGPAMNILRSPIAGRIWESYSEDPFLSGEAATYIIKAIQSTGVIACAKHYVGNDQETNRKNSSSNIPEQALWEIYLEPFYRSVRDADVGSIMSSYNDVNGTLLAKNKRLLQDILKDKIGFKGFVMSDWWAIKDNEVINFNSGEDMNMPGGIDEGGDYKGRDKSHWSDYHTKVGSGITQDRLDDAVRRVLSTMYRFNQLDSNYPDINLDNPTITDATIKINREAAGQSNVLLKNENGVLPITKDKYSKIAIIGNDAFKSDCNKINDCSCKEGSNLIFKGHLGLGYGSGTTDFQYIIAPYDAIKERADGLGISIVKAGESLEQITESSAPSDLSALNPSDFLFLDTAILSGWNSGDVNIDLTSVVTDSTTTLTLYVFGELNGTPDLQVRTNETNKGIKNNTSDEYSMNFWAGQTTNIIEITLNSTSVDLIKATTSKIITLYGNGVTLRAVTTNKALLEAEPFKSISNSISFTVGKENITEAEALATNNPDIKLFIVFIMADSGEEYISLEKSVGDRYDMDAWHNGNGLVNAIVAKKKSGQKILVVINAPGPINVPWKDSVDAIVFSGMGGAESGNGLADVLFGDLNPSGHLPYVWGTIDQYPAVFNILGNYTYYDYSEGVFIGQRYFDKHGKTPKWPFGFGLSYTEFEFSGLTAIYDSTNKQLVATFSVKNKGTIDGDAVPMLFLHFPDTIKSDCDGGDYPNKLFKGFEKVLVKAGQTNTVKITVDEHALSYYSVSLKSFVRPSGTFKVYIGKDASDSALSADVTIS
jgi:beta-glucosidase-like glycosyl hydrolase